MTGNVPMTSCGPDSMVISDLGSGNIVRMTLEDGRLLWSSDSIQNPGGIFYHPAGYVFVVSSSVCHTTISVLDETDGNLFCFLSIITINKAYASIFILLDCKLKRKTIL